MNEVHDLGLDRRVAQVRLVFLILLLLAPIRLFWVEAVERTSLLVDPSNARLEERLALRGKIEDRRGRSLAESRGDRRVYPRGALACHWTGFYSREFGLTGAERWKHDLLRERRAGDGKSSSRGHRLALSLDLDWQKKLRLTGPGAAILVELDTGQVLAAAASPDFDPSRCGADWTRWLQDPAQPTLNRAFLGVYPNQRLYRAWAHRWPELPLRPAYLMDWVAPMVKDGQPLITPAQVAAVVLKAGSPLNLSQLRSLHRVAWKAEPSFWQELPWKHQAGAHLYQELAEWKGQRVRWTVAIGQGRAVVWLEEQPGPRLPSWQSLVTEVSSSSCLPWAEVEGQERGTN